MLSCGEQVAKDLSDQVDKTTGFSEVGPMAIFAS